MAAEELAPAVEEECQRHDVLGRLAITFGAVADDFTPEKRAGDRSCKETEAGTGSQVRRLVLDYEVSGASHPTNQLSLSSEMGGRGMRIVLLLVILTLLGACKQEPVVTGSIDTCVTDLFPSFNRKDLHQCVAACIKCERGVMTSCSTACRLRGAE